LRSRLISGSGCGTSRRSILYHSRDDSEIPFENLERYRHVLPHAKVRALEGRGHEFDQPQFPELAADIRRLTGR
jgi:predicted alpha/beta hydrolase family esterase